MESETSLCSVCGTEFPREGTSGVCPACVMQQAMQPTGPTMAWEPPTVEELAAQLPQYEVECLLGRGGMGAVYKGRQPGLDRAVAIKILSGQLDDDVGRFTARFQTEARAMARLKHPAIVTVHDFGQTHTGLRYLVMEFVEGMDVQKMITKEGRLHTAEAIAIAAHVCDALQYAHSHGVIHRDIKPANVIVGYDGHVRVADFGLAKLAGNDPSALLTQPGTVMGTPCYMAPEALTLGMEVDHRADIYAVGVMLHHMLTGKPPQGAFTPASKLVQGLDPRLDDVIQYAMQEDRDLRCPDAATLRAELDGVLTQPVEQTILTPHAEPQRASARPGARPAPMPLMVAEDDAYEDDDATREMLRTTRSLSTTLLMLGCTALLVLGALVIVLAGRKTGDTYHTEQTITTSETHNSYFTQIIAAGLSTEEELKNIAEIRPYLDRYIGITRQPLSWPEAQAFARQAGAQILEIPPGPAGQAQSLWIAESYRSQLESNAAWTREGIEPRLLTQQTVQTTTDIQTSHLTLLEWRLPEKTETPQKP